MKNFIIAALVAVITIGGSVSVFAATQTVETTASVEVRVWQGVSDGSLYLSTRPEGGSWTTHNTALDMSEISSSRRFRQSSFVTVAVPVSVTVPDSPTPPSMQPDSQQEGIGAWEYFDGENVNGSYVGYSLVADSHDGYSFELAPLLVVRCGVGDNANNWIFVGTPWLLHGGDNQASISYRFSGDATATNEAWSSNEEFDSTVAPISNRFQERLSGASGTLFMAFTSLWDGDTNTATFEVTGAPNVFAALDCF